LERQSLPDVARTNLSNPVSTTVPAGEKITPKETEPATPTFDQRIVIFLRGILLWTYLLVLLIFLLLLALKLWQRAQRKREQRENQS
jgi:hypothetical protein